LHKNNLQYTWFADSVLNLFYINLYVLLNFVNKITPLDPLRFPGIFRDEALYGRIVYQHRQAL